MIGPDEKDDPDARAFSPCASAIERMLEEDEKNPIPLAPQHWPKRGSRQALCGAYGFDAGSPIGVTCAQCRALLLAAKLAKTTAPNGARRKRA